MRNNLGWRKIYILPLIYITIEYYKIVDFMKKIKYSLRLKRILKNNEIKELTVLAGIRNNVKN